MSVLSKSIFWSYWRVSRISIQRLTIALIAALSWERRLLRSKRFSLRALKFLASWHKLMMQTRILEVEGASPPYCHVNESVRSSGWARISRIEKAYRSSLLFEGQKSLNSAFEVALNNRGELACVSRVLPQQPSHKDQKRPTNWAGTKISSSTIFRAHWVPRLDYQVEIRFLHLLYSKNSSNSDKEPQVSLP